MGHFRDDENSSSVPLLVEGVVVTLTLAIAALAFTLLFGDDVSARWVVRLLTWRW